MFAQCLFMLCLHQAIAIHLGLPSITFTHKLDLSFPIHNFCFDYFSLLSVFEIQRLSNYLAVENEDAVFSCAR